MFLFQAFPFFVTCIFLYLFNINKDWLTDKAFWIRFLVIFIVLGFDRHFYYHVYLLDWFEPADKYFLGRVIKRLSSLFTTVIPLILIGFLLENRNDYNLYGLKYGNFNWKPYAVLLGIASIFIWIGSYFGDIQAFYPRYAKTMGDAFADNHNMGEWLSVLIFELSYGFDFISIEFVFRGFMVLAFSRLLGGYTVLAMVTSYCFLHFDKPLGETISSIVGGYVLGIISLKTRTIWGGIWIHMGVAWLMELFGFLQRLH